nr:hypothetical protein [Priestia megaterium]
MDNRTIDRLVAEKVMGFEVRNGQRVEDGKRFGIPSYSQKIKDAWDVVEKIGIDFTMNTVNEHDIHVRAGELELIGQYHCNINGFHVYDKSAPLAICKAALKTVGVEV